MHVLAYTCLHIYTYISVYVPASHKCQTVGFFYYRAILTFLVKNNGSLSFIIWRLQDGGIIDIYNIIYIYIERETLRKQTLQQKTNLPTLHKTRTQHL